jgi:hypothetical protein
MRYMLLAIRRKRKSPPAAIQEGELGSYNADMYCVRH